MATLDQIAEQGYTLSASSYVERKREEVEPPSVTRKRYLDLVKDKLKELLRKGGYVDE